MSRAPAVLCGNHGVFTFGPSPESAVKSAIMCEDVARTVYAASMLALSHGLPQPKPLSPDEIAKWWDRYHSWYGQQKIKKNP
jgi:L-ribulose-5-phosphate 4-epimerase